MFLLDLTLLEGFLYQGKLAHASLDVQKRVLGEHRSKVDIECEEDDLEWKDDAALEGDVFGVCRMWLRSGAAELC